MASSFDQCAPSLVQQYLSLSKVTLDFAKEQSEPFIVRAQCNAALLQMAQALKWHLIRIVPPPRREELYSLEAATVSQRFVSIVKNEICSDSAAELCELLQNEDAWITGFFSTLESITVTPALFKAKSINTVNENIIASTDGIHTDRLMRLHWSQQPLDYYFSCHQHIEELVSRHSDAAVEN